MRNDNGNSKTISEEFSSFMQSYVYVYTSITKDSEIFREASMTVKSEAMITI